MTTKAEYDAAAAAIRHDTENLITSMVPAMFQGTAHQYVTDALVLKFAKDAVDAAAAVRAKAATPEQKA